MRQFSAGNQWLSAGQKRLLQGKRPRPAATAPARSANSEEIDRRRRHKRVSPASDTAQLFISAGP
jgi:hypothetical protein